MNEPFTITLTLPNDPDLLRVLYRTLLQESHLLWVGLGDCRDAAARHRLVERRIAITDLLNTLAKHLRETT